MFANKFSLISVKHFLRSYRASNLNQQRYFTKLTSATTIKFNNGKEIPIIGLGTWKSKPGEVVQAVRDAIDAGYRHIDCALVYQNETEVGEGLHAKMKKGKIKRKDVFITSKLWNTHHRPDLVEVGAKITLKDLGLDYIDLYLIHWPFAFKEGDNLHPMDGNGQIIFSDIDYVETWKAMEELLKKGLVKSIGISNFNIKQIERLLSKTTVVPANHQFECHPYLNQEKLIEFCKSKNITVTAYSPFGSPDREWADPDEPKLLDDNRIITIGKKYGKSSANVILRWLIQRGVVVIPKSVTKHRIIKNYSIFDFELTADDMKVINGLNRNWRAVGVEPWNGAKHYPF